MMMMGMGSAWMMFFYMLLTLFMVLGFGYIIWVLAAKESGNVKLAGQIISAVIIVLAVILCLYGAVRSPRIGNQMMDQEMMMKQQQNMMKQNMEKMPREMKKIMRENWKK
jgi:4-amino-4-deoxy-L-arabinose transferase-like glycosyltransferase